MGATRAVPLAKPGSPTPLHPAPTITRPVQSIEDGKKYLYSYGLIIDGEPLHNKKIAAILRNLTLEPGTPQKLSNIINAISYILDADEDRYTSSSIAKDVSSAIIETTSPTIEQLSNIASDLKDTIALLAG
ncbi:hypothetical protein NLI96_g11489 [Meripilus lineatus]|uniref:Uncharacterized protein n=1 Tax=Meripilus lineatus TaxID=2056292 RepID=A0AAD5UWJ7_9APHY|nr:hypothetical protein NLI96_g11489 [Physisporinus lineatus]